MPAADEILTLQRLAEFLAGDYARLRLYMGETGFTALARRWLAANAGEPQKLRMLSRRLPGFLASMKPFSDSPELADLARLESAFQAAHSAPEAASISRSQNPGHYRIELHPSVQRLQLRTNATSIWAALTAGELPPPPQKILEPQELLVWRQGANSRFRMLGREEALAIDEITRNGTYEIAQWADHFMRGWLEAGIISTLASENGGAVRSQAC
jgi:soluble lytic murein transglycosylase-like protein